MASNSFGRIFRVTTFGESHGPAMGVVIDGCPAGVSFDQQFLLRQLERRRPGQSAVVSARCELDLPEILSGVFEGKTLGTPIALTVRNTDQRSGDYAQMPDRPGHADDVWREKFGHVDPRGGGRSSGRETVARVMAGAVAEMFLRSVAPELEIVGWTAQIGEIVCPEPSVSLSRTEVDHNVVRMPHQEFGDRAIQHLAQARDEGHSFGGVAEVRVRGVPRGLGQPVFHKLKSDLASGMMGVGATCAIEFGAGFAAPMAEGSMFHQVSSAEAPYGGLRGGISTGEDLRFRVAFKPTSSVLDVAKKGRHDPCIVPRAIPVLEAMTALVLADHLLWQRLDRASWLY